MGDKILKQLIYKSKNRGMKENDLMLGQFAETELSKLSHFELKYYMDLIEENDNDIFLWLTSEKIPPEKYSNIISKIKNIIKLI